MTSAVAEAPSAQWGHWDPVERVRRAPRGRSESGTGDQGPGGGVAPPHPSLPVCLARHQCPLIPLLQRHPNALSFRCSLADFQIEKKIGRGQFSEVYKATCLLDRKTVALKKVQVSPPVRGGRTPLAAGSCLNTVLLGSPCPFSVLLSPSPSPPHSLPFLCK